MMEGQHLRQGLIDDTVLVLQQGHRSRAVWQANGRGPRESATVTIRRCEREFHALPPPLAPIVELVRQAGFFGLLNMQYMQLDLALLTALVERWRPETHTFHLTSGEATVTLQDVEIIIGLPVDGRPVTGSTNLNWEEMVRDLLGLELEEAGRRRGNKVTLQWLRGHFNGQVQETDTQVQIEQKARGYIMQLIGGPHTCVSRNVSQDHANLTARYMVRHITTILKKDASTKIKVLQEIIKIATESYNPSYAKTWAAKTLAIGDIYGNWDESYAELPRYLAAVKVRNPGTEYVINTTESNIPGCAIFIRVFWAFGPAIEAFKHCRPVLSVDGTFLAGKYKAVMLIAMSQDAENECVPIAFAIVEKEDAENWGWFLNCIRCFVTMKKNLCLISDRAAGLMSYMPTDPLWRPPYVYHRYCARHIGANFMRRYNKKVGIQVKVTAMEVQKRKYKHQLSKMINWEDGKIHKELTDLDRPKWSLAYDGGR
ncbi:hypothetical protein Vadar_013271 [Vaccinium darrowii]|uniref:Uncharacterized protein n=1 Tax=Vaccinium darrowii TaxID=229202 RepID=A0ACB7XHQ4_9ERIC|nr:hypothetical protein Vadar_013271 [Vaccinium darrowii]